RSGAAAGLRPRPWRIERGGSARGGPRASDSLAHLPKRNRLAVYGSGDDGGLHDGPHREAEYRDRRAPAIPRRAGGRPERRRWRPPDRPPQGGRAIRRQRPDEEEVDRRRGGAGGRRAARRHRLFPATGSRRTGPRRHGDGDLVSAAAARAVEFASSPKREPTFVRGSMATLWDDAGREYID